MNADKIPVLIADDSEDDHFFFKRAAKALEKLEIVGSVLDGEALVAYLSGTAPYEDRSRFPIPRLLLLDLQMPRKNGFEILQWLRQRETFREIIVVVVSGSRREEDIRQALRLGADYYQAKPNEAAAWADMLRTIEFYAERQRKKE